MFEEEAIVEAAGCGPLDPVLANVIARKIQAWMETAAQESKNTDYYRDLLDQVARVIGQEAYTADDGTICDDPIRAKIPELVTNLCKGGTGLIALERMRQIHQEGFDAEHDKQHTFMDLANVGSCYAYCAEDNPGAEPPLDWPYGFFYNPQGPLRNLIKAGALIAAAIDRLIKEYEES